MSVTSFAFQVCLKQMNKPHGFLGFLLIFCFLFLIGSELNGIFVGPELKFGFRLFRLVMGVEILAFHPKTEGVINFCTTLIQTPQFSFEAFLLLVTLRQFGFVFPSLLVQLGRVQQGGTWAGLYLISERPIG